MNRRAVGITTAVLVALAALAVWLAWYFGLIFTNPSVSGVDAVPVPSAAVTTVASDLEAPVGARLPARRHRPGHRARLRPHRAGPAGWPGRRGAAARRGRPGRRGRALGHRGLAQLRDRRLGLRVLHRRRGQPHRAPAPRRGTAADLHRHPQGRQPQRRPDRVRTRRHALRRHRRRRRPRAGAGPRLPGRKDPPDDAGRPARAGQPLRRTPWSTRTGTATCRASPGTPPAGSSRPSSARTGTTSSTSSSPAATTAGHWSRARATDRDYVNPLATWATSDASPSGIAVSATASTSRVCAAPSSTASARRA